MSIDEEGNLSLSLSIEEVYYLFVGCIEEYWKFNKKANKTVEYGQIIDANSILFNNETEIKAEERIDLLANKAIIYKNLSSKLENILKDTNLEKINRAIEEYKKYKKEHNEMKKKEEELKKKIRDT